MEIRIITGSIGSGGEISLSGGEGDILSQIARQLLGESFDNSYDLGSAHFWEFSAPEHIPHSYFVGIRNLSGDVKEKGKFETKEYPNLPNMHEVFEQMIFHETSLSTKRKHLHPVYLSTRRTLDYVFNEVATKKGKKIAVPLPSWHFWKIGEERKPAHMFHYFDAINEAQFVDNFTKVAKNKDVGALVFSDPANPLLYRISESAAKAIDKVALKNGVEIIVDDVLRGTFPLGQRDSVGRFFTRPYIVEGMSKRFGDEPFGRISYCLAPEKVGFPDKYLLNGDSYSLLFGSGIDMALQHSSTPALNELEKRNKAFDDGMRKEWKDAKITRPSPTCLVSLVELPKNGHSAYNFATGLYLRERIVVNPVSIFYPDSQLASSELRSLFRVSVGKNQQSELFKIGQLIGGCIRDAYS